MNIRNNICSTYILETVKNTFVIGLEQRDIGAAFDLLPGNGERGVPVAGLDGLGEPGRAGDVGALANDDEGGRGGFHNEDAKAQGIQVGSPLAGDE